jgi:hypothetical protein
MSSEKPQRSKAKKRSSSSRKKGSLSASTTGALARSPWWVWPGLLVTIAILTLTMCLVFEPRPDEFCYVFGHKFGDNCKFNTLTGFACPQCGMTRSWVWAARLHFYKAFLYNPAGVGLYLWIQVAGIIGALRLLARNPRSYIVSRPIFAGWVVFWFLGLYLLPWLARLGGINPLP